MKNYLKRIIGLENGIPISAVRRVELEHDDTGRPCAVKEKFYDDDGNVIKEKNSTFAELVKYETGR